MAKTNAPTLPFELTALEPCMTKKQLDLHFNKHHMGYYKKFCELTKNDPDAKVEEIIKKNIAGKLYNNTAQLYNHQFFWRCLINNSKKFSNEPSGELKALIETSFKSFDVFQAEFEATSIGHFGSGWVWLVYNTSTKLLELFQGHDAQCPLSDQNLLPLLACDLWEHAYYVDYENRRDNYLSIFWKLVNWNFVENMLKHKRFDYNNPDQFY